jgi:hypothetical protein
VADERVEILERDFHHQAVKYTRKAADTNGVWHEVISQYHQVENGLNRPTPDGKWVPVTVAIQGTQDGARFDGAECSIEWRTTPENADAVVLSTIDGNRYVSHVIGLAYFDKQSGDSVLLSEVVPVAGQLASDKELVYPSCFSDGVEADLVYRIGRTTFSQDVRVRSQLPLPQDFNLNPTTTELEVLTEFIEASDPLITRQSTDSVSPTETSETGATETDLGDTRLQFGLFEIGLGRAFLTAQGDDDGSGEFVRKRWAKLSGRQTLIEALDFPKAATWLGTLPKPKTGAALKSKPVLRREATNRPLPKKPARYEQAGRSNPKGIRKVVASLDHLPTPGPALVMDYQSIVGSTLADYSFKANETYYISGAVTLTGTVSFEGNTVLKFANSTNGPVGMTLQSASNSGVACNGGMYRPIVMTAIDDFAVGAAIAGGVPGGYAPLNTYANPALYFDASSTANGLNLSNFQVRFAKLGFKFKNNGTSGSGHTLRHVQFYGGETAIRAEGNATVAVRNALFATLTSKAFDLAGTAVVDAQQVTVAEMPYVVAGGTLKLTNSILSSITSAVASGATFSASSVNVVTNGGYGSYGNGYYGQFYLLPSTFQDLGTTNIDATLLADLKLRTTEMPAFDYYTIDFYLPSAVARDSGAPDLGYHYDPVDVLTVTDEFLGTNHLVLPAAYVVATAEAGGTSLSGVFEALGEPKNPVWLVRAELVQEQPNILDSHEGAPVLNSQEVSGWNVNYCNFSTFPGSATLSLSEISAAARFSNCQFFCGSVEDVAGVRPDLGVPVRTNTFWNNLFRRSNINLSPTAGGAVTVVAQNNTFVLSSVTVAPAVPFQWSFYNNLFYNTAITQGSVPVQNGYNGYVTNGFTTLLYPTGPGNVVLNTSPFVTGSLGLYYLNPSSGLVDAGNSMASLSGLFFHTTSTSQAIEGMSQVDIGFHYPALDGSGNPYYSGGGYGVITDPTGSTYLNAQTTAAGNGPTQGFSVTITKPVNGKNQP